MDVIEYKHLSDANYLKARLLKHEPTRTEQSRAGTDQNQAGTDQNQAGTDQEPSRNRSGTFLVWLSFLTHPVILWWSGDDIRMLFKIK